MKFQNVPSIMPFPLTDDPQFHGLEMFLSNILMICLFHSNKRMVFFLKTEKNPYHRKKVGDHRFTTSTWKRGGEGGLEGGET